MSKIINKPDISICPTSGANNIINQIELAESDHDTCPHLNAILKLLTNVNLPLEYRIKRAVMMAGTLEEFIKQLRSQTDA